MVAPTPPITAPRAPTGSHAAIKAGIAPNTTDPLTGEGTRYPPAYEASVLYAANQVDAAREMLKAHLRTEEGKGHMRSWLMLFDLYQLTQNQADFDQLSMLFTVRFERSPPLWNEAHTQLDPRRKEKRERKDLFVVTPTSDGALLGEIDRLEPFAAAAGSARIDFGKVRSIFVEEAELLSMVLHRLRRARVPIWFNGLREFTDLLKRNVNEQNATPGSNQGYWSLLFEILILDGKLEEYEELGLEYAVAYEMSPPAWESVVRPSGAADDAVDEAPVANGFPLKGVVSAASRDMLQQLTLYAQPKAEVLVDMSSLMRIDFNAVTFFLETIRAMHTAQKRVILANANELVASFLEVFAANKHAIIMRKKAG